MKYILAHDLGTSGNKASLFSEDGKMLGSSVTAYDAHYFNSTWVEQDADDWLFHAWPNAFDANVLLYARNPLVGLVPSG
jgi:sugar (pentulose or hexulose) kinase